jgi:hypothetical protein
MNSRDTYTVRTYADPDDRICQVGAPTVALGQAAKDRACGLRSPVRLRGLTCRYPQF